MKISAVIIAGNEEKKIGDAIRSVAWADEVLVIDSESTDRTREIAAELGARVIVQPWLGFSAQKQYGADAASNDHILSLDADERVSDDLRDEIRGLTDKGSSIAAGYRIPRLSYYMGRPIRHSGWYPDHQLRLFDRRHARWNGALIHESVTVENGSVDKLNGHILHYTVDNALEHHRMIGTRYAPLAAQQMVERGKRTSPVRLYTSGAAAFLRSYVLKLGFLDGLPGFCIARFAGHHAFLKHLCLWELQNSGDAASTPTDN